MAEKSVSTESLGTPEVEAYTGKKLSIAMIGCGGISETHLKALQSFQDVEVVAGVDIKQSRLDVMKTKYGIERLYTDWKKMLKEVKPDAVSICTPNGVHFAPAIDASNAGCHVFVEKPMAMNPAECQKMIDTAKKNSSRLGFSIDITPIRIISAAPATMAVSGTSCS